MTTQGGHMAPHGGHVTPQGRRQKLSNQDSEILKYLYKYHLFTRNSKKNLPGEKESPKDRLSSILIMVGTSGPHVIFPEDKRGWGR